MISEACSSPHSNRSTLLHCPPHPTPGRLLCPVRCTRIKLKDLHAALEDAHSWEHIVDWFEVTVVILVLLSPGTNQDSSEEQSGGRRWRVEDRGRKIWRCSTAASFMSTGCLRRWRAKKKAGISIPTVQAERPWLRLSLRKKPKTALLEDFLS